MSAWTALARGVSRALTPVAAAAALAVAACEGTTASIRGIARQDREPPTVVATAPADGAQLTTLPAVVRAIFSEPVEPASVTPTPFRLRASDVVIVAATVATNRDTVTLTPAGPLDFNTTYTGVLTTDISDLAGNPLGAPFTGTFTTPGVP